VSDYERDEDGFLTHKGVREYMVREVVGVEAYERNPKTHALVEHLVTVARQLERTEAQLPEDVTPHRKKQAQVDRKTMGAAGVLDDVDVTGGQ